MGARSVHGLGLSPDCLELVRVKLDRPTWPKSFHGLKIAFLSDIHYGGGGGVGSALVLRSIEMAQAERPDVFCFGGDLITGWGERGSLADLVSMVRDVTAPLGAYAVLGNHEFNWGERDVMREFDRTGVRLLRNETIFLERGPGRIPLTGLDNMFNLTWREVRRQMESLEDHPGAIVLEHTPDLAPMLPDSFHGTLLAGHTHGGQIILPFVRQAMTASRFGLKYVAGLYPAGRGAMYITRGVGAVLVPMRIGCPPEVTIIEFSVAGQERA